MNCTKAPEITDVISRPSNSLSTTLLV